MSQLTDEEWKTFRIYIGKMDIEDYERAVQVFKKIRSAKAEIVATSYNVGDEVTFVGRRNELKFGKLVKMGPKKAQVRVEGEGTWKVPYVLLKKL
jgi:hypothetical protein